MELRLINQTRKRHVDKRSSYVYVYIYLSLSLSLLRHIRPVHQLSFSLRSTSNFPGEGMTVGQQPGALGAFSTSGAHDVICPEVGLGARGHAEGVAVTTNFSTEFASHHGSRHGPIGETVKVYQSLMLVMKVMKGYCERIL